MDAETIAKNLELFAKELIKILKNLNERITRHEEAVEEPVRIIKDLQERVARLEAKECKGCKTKEINDESK